VAFSNHSKVDSMKKLLQILVALIPLLILSEGCAQVPPASKGYNVTVTATAPVASGNWAGCTTTNPCVYAVYRCSLGTACTSTTSTGWAEVTTATTRPSSPSYVDSTATGLNAYYNMETIQGTQNSAPSNVVLVAVPGIPLAPTLGTPTAANLAKPALPLVNEDTKELASNIPPLNVALKISR
jgi:hypothetical protein